MAVTHDMVAVKLGINRTTVTKALKGDLSIKQKTRKIVIDTATKMGYDFKQSQQNRREGKRYFAREDIDFKLMDQKNHDNFVMGTGRITNLSSTGMLVKLETTITGSIPLAHLLIEIMPSEACKELSKIPYARIVRINYIGQIECAAKFENDESLSDEILSVIEKQSFKNIDKVTENQT
jgi:hypothetical protein